MPDARIEGQVKKITEQQMAAQQAAGGGGGGGGDGLMDGYADDADLADGFEPDDALA